MYSLLPRKEAMILMILLQDWMYPYCKIIFLTYPRNRRPRTSDRIDFVGELGFRGTRRRVNKDMKLAFSMYPTTIADLMAISDAGEVMPLSLLGLNQSLEVAYLSMSYLKDSREQEFMNYYHKTIRVRLKKS